MERTILHCDCNGFFASVECILHPELKKVPMAVAGDPESRHGIILAKNELAKRYNVQTAETVWQARRKCPDLVLVSPHHSEYRKYSDLVNRIYERYTDLIERFGIDESWLDVTGSRRLFGRGEQIADELRAVVKKELGLTISVGVSFNKIFAKLGSDYKKPDATTVISRENYRDIVFPLPVSALLYVGKSVNKELAGLGIQTIGDLARSDQKLLKSRLGRMGEMIHNYANGLDTEPVESAYAESKVKSVGNGMTFRRNLQGWDDIKAAVAGLSDTVGTRMRRMQVKCSTVQVMIKDPAFQVISRQKKLNKPTYLTKEINAAALEIIRPAWNIREPIRALTITGANLVPAAAAVEQISLFEGETNQDRRKQEQLETTIDKIRGKFGKESVALGIPLKDDLGIIHHPKKEPMGNEENERAIKRKK